VTLLPASFGDKALCHWQRRRRIHVPPKPRDWGAARCSLRGRAGSWLWCRDVNLRR